MHTLRLFGTALIEECPWGQYAEAINVLPEGEVEEKQAAWLYRIIAEREKTSRCGVFS